MPHSPAALLYAVKDILLTVSWLRHCVGIVTRCNSHSTLCMRVHCRSLSCSSDTEPMQTPEDDHKRLLMLAGLNPKTHGLGCTNRDVLSLVNACNRLTCVV